MNVQSPKSERRSRKRLALPVSPGPVAESKHTADAAPTAADAESGAADREVKVALAAYFIAEKRGFEPGHELDDWLAAEAQIAKAEEPSVVESVQLLEVQSLS